MQWSKTFSVLLQWWQALVKMRASYSLARWVWRTDQKYVRRNAHFVRRLRTTVGIGKHCVPRVENIPGLSVHDMVYAEFNITTQKKRQAQRQTPRYNSDWEWESLKEAVNNLGTALKWRRRPQQVQRSYVLYVYTSRQHYSVLYNTSSITSRHAPDTAIPGLRLAFNDSSTDPTTLMLMLNSGD